MKMLSDDTIEAQKLMLLLVPEVLNTVDIVSGFNKLLRVINPVMSVSEISRESLLRKPSV